MRALRILKYGLIGLFLIAVLAGAGAIAVLYTFGRDLPDVSQLEDYEPPVTTRIYASDGQLLEEYARERRLFVPVSAMPEQLIDAFIAAEDQNFYAHPGIDFVGIGRAVITNIRNYATDRRPVGASTITQQVAKNFLLSNEVSYERKIKEALLAFRMEEAFTKDQILELYLNEIYLGQGAYGVAAAALYYFDKPLGELDLPEVAYLAALPKAPNNYHPIHDRQAAVARRNWVLGRMQEEGFITAEERAEAVATPLLVRRGRGVDLFEAAYFNEEVRRRLMQQFGENKLYEGGLAVRTTLEPRLQQIAEKALQDGLIEYDRRHGYRGAVAQVELAGWREALGELEVPVGRKSWMLGVVLDAEEGRAMIGLEDGRRGVLPLSEVRWARKPLRKQYVGPRPEKVSDVLTAGDVIIVEPLGLNDGSLPLFGLRQVPEAEGALVAMDPHTGRVLAMVGGYDYEVSEFNRATQA
ncbi:MAG: transglycosylase domain-containing protein, partial [Alphaproteobacteria bacterium]|nr:transglycosylase domain-containing protein [Alphaproteobacteria bacterium]